MWPSSVPAGSYLFALNARSVQFFRELLIGGLGLFPRSLRLGKFLEGRVLLLAEPR